MKSRFSAISILALTVGILPFSASAADILSNKGDPTSAVYQEAPSPVFQGLGIGVSLGGQFTNVEIGDKGFSFDGIGADGLVGGVHAEYLFGVAGNFRVGPYVEVGFSNVNTNVETPWGDGDLLEQKHYYGAGIKAGVIVGNVLVGGRVGVERAHWDVAEKFDAEVDSFVVGPLVEAMVAQQVSLGLSLDYVDAFNIEADGKDVTDLFDETEGFRGVVRLTYRR
jgi:hypothetical protein